MCVAPTARFKCEMNVALEGAVRNRDDPLALLDNTPTRTLAKVAPIEVIAPA
jgi:hypothetical protein